MKNYILVTGAAGFIGYHMVNRLCLDYPESTIIGIDNLNDYYDVQLKNARLKNLDTHTNFHFLQGDITDTDFLDKTFSISPYQYIIHLAAQAGVQYSLTAPHEYVKSNITGFLNILEACRTHETPQHLLYASSSSVYGLNTVTPFSESHQTDSPASLYAASKKANEEMAHTYAHLFNIPATGLRFFTVYGEWGRPDMAFFKFTQGIINGTPIKVFNHGNMQRDFTYIDDIIEGMMRLLPLTPQKTPAHAIYNIGNGQPINLLNYIQALEKAIGKKAILEMLPLQAGDVLTTYADTTALETATGWHSTTSIEQGIEKFLKWYHSYYTADAAA